MARLSRHAKRLCARVPSWARQALYELHPGRARRWRRFAALERTQRGRAHAALTLDDGPDEDATPAVLDALDASGARAIFFLLESRRGVIRRWSGGS